MFVSLRRPGRIELQPNQIRQFRSNISKLGASKTILISTHILQEVEAVAERVLLVDSGRLVFDGTPSELRQNGSLEEAFYRLTGSGVDINAAGLSDGGEA